MSRSEPELWTALEQADEMDHGEAQQAIMEDVVRHADAGGFPRLAFAARRGLASAYSVDRQWHKAFPLFARCLAEYDQRPWQFGPEEDWSLRNWYTSIAQSMAEFPDVTLAQIYGAFEDMERRFRAGGHSLVDVHAARRWVAQLACDWAEEERCYQAWIAAGGANPRSVWDFEPEVERLVLRGDETSLAKAREIAAPVLAGQIGFDEPPVPIQCLMLVPLAKAGAYADAASAYRRSGRSMEYGVYRYEYSGMRIEFCALTGNEDAGLRELKRRLHGFPTLNRPNGKMEFATSAAVLLGRLVAVGRGGEMVGCVCGEEPAVPAAKLRDDMSAIALDLATRFDHRNGTTAQGDRIRRKLTLQPVADFVPLTPTSRRRRRNVPAGLQPEQAVERAEWHLRAYEGDLAVEYLDSVATPPHLAARVAEMRAVVNWDEAAEPALRWAADQHRNAGDHRRYLLCLAWLGRWLAEYERGKEALELTNWVVAELHKTGDAWGIAYGELRLAQVLVTLGKSACFPAIERAAQFAATARDPLAIGVIATMEASWRYAEYEDAARAIPLATMAKDVLMAAGSFAKTLDSFDVLKSACDEAAFAGIVRNQLANLPPNTHPRVVAYLRYERGRGLLAEDRPADAIADLTESVAEFAATEDDYPEQWYHLSVACHAAGRFDEAVTAATTGAVWLQNVRGELDEPTMADVCRFILADSSYQLGEAEAAVDHYDELIENARAAGNLPMAARALTTCAEILSELDRDAEAAPRFGEAADLQVKINDQAAAGYCRCMQAMCLQWAGDSNGALATLSIAEHGIRAMPDATAMTWGYLGRAAATILAIQGRGPEAVQHAARASTAFHQAGAVVLAVRMNILQADVLTKDGRPDLAEPALRSALALCPEPSQLRTAVEKLLAGLR
ncbi:hypothetical protein [Actinocrispum wychmicini]|uniref:Tetratricopeptide repeat protein n=1 Tax=Actinocrispum wychmicini TaxID=1213861 RepID=A0A4R2K2I2_9PSEU|nr:hypothetical protein [Actinocrispum wychmicini]TCO60515.1 hypothetical protein EV192_10390 [Actinocrispum wychmicini]